MTEIDPSIHDLSPVALYRVAERLEPIPADNGREVLYTPDTEI